MFACLSEQAPPEKFGETLEAEQLRAGSFIEDSDVDADQWDRMMVRLRNQSVVRKRRGRRNRGMWCVHGDVDRRKVSD